MVLRGWTLSQQAINVLVILKMNLKMLMMGYIASPLTDETADTTLLHKANQHRCEQPIR